ncbi:hypothetical protein SDC9_163846 [bioreactor metagenome]|uniref:Uncharacterized protein n=1 Tax=bioreactor metagenome TaxID=1076179 RepID=A0A645FSA1_9ZZZZ
MRQAVEPGHHGAAARGQRRNRFEISVGVAHAELDHERQRGKRRQHRPHQDHQQEAVAHAEIAGAVAVAVPEEGAAQLGEQEDQIVGALRAIVGAVRNDQRRQQGQTEQHQDHAEGAMDGGETGHDLRAHRKWKPTWNSFSTFFTSFLRVQNMITWSSGSITVSWWAITTSP